ncbi:type II toxin-antitoxin system RelE/ParE family toxin [Halotalea alkalilenta]|uniref:Uncharacterized protein n=1 Tax=Halotalea alkalilenta TaxID=376489 RepID=A0A172YF33_9GAMM|nr:type II toxin-antitoxin system RelE/ParE family toxin [Halotalea alkalilenta]ANF57726.1 hypothetical protein A5892_09835 [Halotalea alkalilenta]
MSIRFRYGWLHDFFNFGASHRSILASLEGALARKLDLIDASTSEADLRVPPGNRFEHLNGTLRGKCSIRVNPTRGAGHRRQAVDRPLQFVPKEAKWNRAAFHAFA